jgi:hypothetical protein
MIAASGSLMLFVLLRVSASNIGASGIALENDGVSLRILGGPDETFRPAQVSPIIFISLERDDFFSLRSHAQIAINDGKGTLFTHHPEKTRRDYMDSAKSQRSSLVVNSNRCRSVTA